MGFHRFHLQANRLPFYPPCLHGSQIFKKDGFFGRNVGWMNGNQHNWLDGWYKSSGSVLRSDLGNKRMYWFLWQDLWNVCLFAFFSVPNVQMVSSLVFTFLPTRKMRKIPFNCNSRAVFRVFFPHLSRPTLDLKTLIMFSMALRKPRFFL